jgi:hypothetical protein
MPTRRSVQLADAMRGQRLVQFSRQFESSTIRGYVLDAGPRFFLIALVSDRIRFDGFECFRSSDVKNVRPGPYTAFVQTALRKRGERRPKVPRVSVANIEELLVSTGRTLPLVTIRRERVAPDVCWIGRVLSIDRGRVSIPYCPSCGTKRMTPSTQCLNGPSPWRTSCL